MQSLADVNGTLKTCKVTIVQPGRSDAVIKIYPAEHESEKIWLDNTRGIERWEEVQRFMYNFAMRGHAIAKPVQYHSSTKDLRTIEITEADIPTVTLENAVLKAPPSERGPATAAAQNLFQAPVVDNSVIEMKIRMDTLEKNVALIGDSLSKITDKLLGANPPDEPVAPRSIHEELRPATMERFEPVEFSTCTECGKDMKRAALAMHMGKYHKK